TFNAAIGVGLAPYAEQRLDAIERALPALGADIICLQELWQPDDLERLASNLAGEFPYSHRSVQASGAGLPARCTDSEATLLLECLTTSCAGVENAGLPICAIANCAGAFTQTARPCQQCVVANQDAPDVTTLIDVCSSSDDSAESFEAQTGLLLLSKLPLAKTDYLALESALADRGVLGARMQSGGGSIDVYCTHLAASLGEVPYAGAYGSWQGERRAQIDQFLPWVEETRDTGGRAVLLGDMNCGPGTSLAQAASPDAFALFSDAGFVDPYAEGDGRCTFCGDNPLNGSGNDPDEGALIDHVLLSGFADAPVVVVQRVLDGEISINDGGSDIVTAHSDHYGVQVMVSWAEPAP
ncbi:MAG TPA: endonuclease/exonuclease/phosphatase family protein, partial [Polyangiaceae bacterium]|nr:endonuclease/exonuclease/phosphatase family protein [Polyangiaceae bacterium]